MAVKAIKTMALAGEICHSPAIAWSSDNRISLAIDGGIHIMEPILNGNDPTPFTCRRSFISTPSEPLVFDVGCDKTEISKNSNRDVLTQMMLDRTLCPETIYANKCKGYRTACWSPHSPSRTYRSVLVSLTTDHRLVVHIEQQGSTWDLLEDLSLKFYQENVKTQFSACDTSSFLGLDLDSSTLEYYVFKARTYFLSAIEMIWTQCFTSDGQDFAFFITAMKSGYLVFWRFNLPCTNCEMISIESIHDTGMGFLTSIVWQQTSKNDGILVVGSYSGQVQMIPLHVLDEMLSLGNPATLWDEEDSMAVRCSAIGRQQTGNYVVVCGKSNFIISTLVTPQGELIRQAVSEGIHSLPLTNICSLINGWFLASSLDFNTYKFQVDTVGEDITLMEEIVVFDVPTNKIMPYGIIQSPNAVFCCLVQRISCLYDHLAHRDPIKINFFINQEEDAIWTNLLSCEKPFSVCKDIQEFIRVRLNFENALPKVMTEILDSGIKTMSEQSAFVLKLSRYIFGKQVSQLNSGQVNKKKSQFSMVSNIIIHKHIISIVNLVDSDIDYKNIPSRKLLSLLIMTEWVLSGTSGIIVTQSEMNAVKVVLSKVRYELPASDQEEKCNICQEIIPFDNIVSGICCKGHSFGRCCQTLLVCDLADYKKCPGCCALMLMDEIWTKEPICTFCDELLT